MNLFNTKFCAKRVGDLARIESEFRHANPDTSGADIPESLNNLKKTIRRSIRAMDGLGMERTQRTLTDILKEIDTKAFLAPALAVHARNSAKAITEELHHRKFLIVDGGLSGLLDNERLFGDAVWENFSHARTDIKEAGNCVAADCNTAAVFHLMRAVEWGLRAFCVHLGRKKLKVINKKTGAVKYRPLDYSEWKPLLIQLKGDIDKRLGKIKRGAKHQEESEFYIPLWQDIEAFREAFRNHIMHAHRDYTASEAAAIMDRVRRFMSLLSTRVSET